MIRRRWLIAMIPLMAGMAWASTLRPTVIVYGELRDAFGVRLHSGAQISAFLNTNEVAKTFAGVYPNQLSYKLMLDVHDPLTADPDEVTPGDTIQLRIRLGAAWQPLIGNDTFSVPGDGSPIRADFILGEDSDGDGLPDAWENMVIANSGGAATSLGDVGPGMDLDGDGMNDDQEFFYGSFAFLAGDELAIDSMSMVNGRYALSFLTVPGAVYRIETSPGIRNPAWDTGFISLTQGGATAPVEFVGDGAFMTIYIEPAAEEAIYRLKAR